VDIFRHLDQLFFYLRYLLQRLGRKVRHFVQLQFKLAGFDRKHRQPLREVVMELPRQPAKLILFAEISFPASSRRSFWLLLSVSSALLRSVMSMIIDCLERVPSM